MNTEANRKSICNMPCTPICIPIYAPCRPHKTHAGQGTMRQKMPEQPHCCNNGKARKRAETATAVAFLARKHAKNLADSKILSKLHPSFGDKKRQIGTLGAMLPLWKLPFFPGVFFKHTSLCSSSFSGTRSISKTTMPSVAGLCPDCHQCIITPMKQ